MSRKAINIITGILIGLIAVFFAGSFAYEQYIIRKSDEQLEQSTQDDLDSIAKDNQSGETNEEAKN